MYEGVCARVIKTNHVEVNGIEKTIPFNTTYYCNTVYLYVAIYDAIEIEAGDDCRIFRQQKSEILSRNWIFLKIYAFYIYPFLYIIPLQHYISTEVWIRLLRVQLEKNMYRFYPRKYGESFRHRNVVRVYSTIHLVNFSAESCSLDWTNINRDRYNTSSDNLNKNLCVGLWSKLVT